MDSEELTFKIDQTYKNLLEKFNPTARQLAVAGKSYLKSLQGASSSCKAFLDVLTKLVSHCQQNPLGTNSDIGSSLEQVVDVFREVEAQQNNIVKAFYVEFIVPLETNLEKDSKVLQIDQKKFSSSQKTRHEAVMKAEQSVRKLRKKKGGSRSGVQKEMKYFQKLEEERSNLEVFLDQGFQAANTEERRRYSFILERLCTIGRHHLALHGKGAALLQKHLDEWGEVCGVQSPPPDLQDDCRSEADCIYSTPTEEHDMEVVGTNRRRAQSLDGFLDSDRGSPISFREVHGQFSRPIPRAKSEFSIDQEFKPDSHQARISKPSSSAASDRCVRVSYPFCATSNNQMSLEEGDVIYLIGERNKGWHYGENRRTHQIGWFPVAYTEQHIEEEDSALGCSYVETSRSSRCKDDSELSISSSRKTFVCSDSRGKSLDRFDHPRSNEKIRPRSTSANDSIPLPNQLRSPMPKHAIEHNLLVHPSEEANICPEPYRPPSSCFDSDTRKTFETYNSHIFLSEDMEEDIASYEGSYNQDRQSSAVCEQGKYTSFGAGYSLSPSLCRSLTSPELPPCFRKSVSSKDSVQCSDDSGFSNEENMQRQRQLSSPYTEACSKSVNSWVTDSCDACDNRQPQMQRTNQTQSEEKSSPTFLNYLYPSNSSTLRQSSSVECLDEVKASCAKKESWIVSAFGTFGRKKKNLVSPCAQKIASQKARKKSERPSLRRSSSLLCIDMSNCTSSPDDIDALNYEDINYATWNQLNKSPNNPKVPAPPPFDPPPLPKKLCTAPGMISHQHLRPKNQISQQRQHLGQKEQQHNPESSSSGNSSWSECDSSCMEAYMVVKDHSMNTLACTKGNIKNGAKKSLARSYTWASPDFKKSGKSPIETKRKMPGKDSDDRSYPSYPVAPPPKPKKRSKSKEKDKKYKNVKSVEEIAPPLPPRRTSTLADDKNSKNQNSVNIFNYSEYMYKRLTNPDGTCRFDQRSFTTGQKCSAWYDLWGDDSPYRGNLV